MYLKLQKMCVLKTLTDLLFFFKQSKQNELPCC